MAVFTIFYLQLKYTLIECILINLPRVNPFNKYDYFLIAVSVALSVCNNFVLKTKKTEIFVFAIKA